MTGRRNEKPLKIWRVPKWIALISLSKSEGIGVFLLLAFAIIIITALAIGIRDLVR
jgi:hypothetical protein